MQIEELALKAARAIGRSKLYNLRYFYFIEEGIQSPGEKTVNGIAQVFGLQADSLRQVNRPFLLGFREKVLRDRLNDQKPEELLIKTPTELLESTLYILPR